MRLIRALGDFLTDLTSGDPVALALAGVFLLMASVVAAIWIIDLRKKQKEKKGKKPTSKPKLKDR
jgi:hypothetical protein